MSLYITAWSSPSSSLRINIDNISLSIFVSISKECVNIKNLGTQNFCLFSVTRYDDISESTAAWAAARRAIGTRNGEQLT